MDRTFAARLGALRKSTEQSQKDAAAALGVSQALLSHYERGIRECGLGFVTRAAAHYNVTCDYLLGTSSLGCGFSEGAFWPKDIPEDNKLDVLTIFRCLTVLRENLQNQPSSCRDEALRYFALTTYRFLVSAINAGDLPRSWIGERAPIENFMFLEYLGGLENVLLDSIERGPQRIHDSKAPLCIKTLANEVEKYTAMQIEQVFNPLSE